MDPIIELKFIFQVMEDSRRTVICPIGLSNQVRTALEALNISSLCDIQESPIIKDHVLILDHNALEAYTRQVLQKLSFKGER